MTIDMAYTEGDDKGRTALGIYKIEDDVLTICRARRICFQPRQRTYAHDVQARESEQ